MAPGYITIEWCKEALETISRLRVFLIDGLRDGDRDTLTPCGINEVTLRLEQIVREGMHTTLPVQQMILVETLVLKLAAASGDVDRRVFPLIGNHQERPVR
jgi:hypothetical protein